MKGFDVHPLLAFIIGFVVLSVFASLLFNTECRDGWHSLSIGQRGACSHHGGVGESFAAFLLVVGGSSLLAFFASFLRNHDGAERGSQTKYTPATDAEQLPPPPTPPKPVDRDQVAIQLSRERLIRESMKYNKSHSPGPMTGFLSSNGMRLIGDECPICNRPMSIEFSQNLGKPAVFYWICEITSHNTSIDFMSESHVAKLDLFLPK